MVFNATFNNISVVAVSFIGGVNQIEYPEKTSDLVCIEYTSTDKTWGCHDRMVI
jgi:hypothetical protein